MISYTVGDKVKTPKGVGKFAGSLGTSGFVSIAGRVIKVRLIDMSLTDDPLSDTLPTNPDAPRLPPREVPTQEQEAQEAEIAAEIEKQVAEAAKGVELEDETEVTEEPEVEVKEEKTLHLGGGLIEESLPDLTKEFLLTTEVGELQRLLEKFGGEISKARKAKLRKAIKEKGGEL